VEALALEVDRGRAEDALNRHAALGVVRERVVGELLENVEGGSVGAAILVEGHGLSSIGRP
jgi:hypothetical protein